MKRIILSFPFLVAVCMSQAQSKKNQQLEEVRKAIIASNAIYSDLANTAGKCIGICLAAIGRPNNKRS